MLDLRLQGGFLRFRTWGLGLIGCRIWGLGFGMWGLGFGVWDLGFRAGGFNLSHLGI